MSRREHSFIAAIGADGSTCAECRLCGARNSEVPCVEDRAALEREIERLRHLVRCLLKAQEGQYDLGFEHGKRAEQLRVRRLIEGEEQPRTG